MIRHAAAADADYADAATPPTFIAPRRLSAATTPADAAATPISPPYER